MVKKAGYYGKLADIEGKIRLSTYESSKEKMGYEEYVKGSRGRRVCEKEAKVDIERKEDEEDEEDEEG